MTAKLIVTQARGGSRISLVGSSGTELLTSKVFSEPRGKGATLRSLKGLLGEDIVVEDHTAAEIARPVVSTRAPRAKVKTARIPSKPPTRRRTRASK